VAFPEVGYCQGMHCVAKFMLMFSEAPVRSPKSAATKVPPQGIMLETEKAFVLFAQLLEDRKYCLAELFHPSLQFFKRVSGDIDAQIEKREPLVFRHLQSRGLTAIVYASKWILTLFTFYVDVDFASVVNVWLRFLSQGWDAVIQIAVASVLCIKEHLLNADAEGCMCALSGTTSFTPHGLLAMVFGTHRGQALLNSLAEPLQRDVPHCTHLSKPHGTQSGSSAGNDASEKEQGRTAPRRLQPSAPGDPPNLTYRVIPNRRYTKS